MATFTVSATGGNWSSTSTWVGGVLPAAGDDIVANASSGNLTVDGNRTCLSINFTNYTNTFTINNGFTLTISGVGATITLGSGMTYASGTTGVLSTVSATTAVTINFNGITIPRLTVGYTNAVTTPVQTITVNGTNPTVQNFIFTNVGRVVFSGIELNISNSFTANGSGVSHALFGSIIFNGTVNYSAAAGQRLLANNTITSGSTLILNSNFISEGNVVTFQTGSFLTHNNFSLSLRGSVTLNTSPVKWYNLIMVVDQTEAILTSDLNIQNNVETNASAFATSTTIRASGGVRNVNIEGSLFAYIASGNNNGFRFINSNLVVNLIGTGQLTGCFNDGIINFNTTNPSGYVLGNSTNNQLTLFRTTLNLVGSTVVTTFNSSHILFGSNATINTNNTGTGGSEIIYANCIIGGAATITFTNDTTFNGNVTAGGSFNFTINGAKVLVRGNFFARNTGAIVGTSTIELIGSNNSDWGFAAESTTYQNNIIINKSGGAIVNILGTITWGTAGRTLQRTAGNINPGSSTVTIPNAAVTISNMVFNNLTFTGGASSTIAQPISNIINGTLTINAATTFTGVGGWTAAGFNSTTAGVIITLATGSTYTATSASTLTGTNASPSQLISNVASSSAIFTLAQGASQNISFITARDINSSQGQTIWDWLGTTATLTRTQNWNPIVSGSPSYLVPLGIGFGT